MKQISINSKRQGAQHTVEGLPLIFHSLVLDFTTEGSLYERLDARLHNPGFGYYYIELYFCYNRFFSFLC
jgi:hypothetical protein